MTDMQLKQKPGHGDAGPPYLEVGRGLASWMFTLDHKRIGIMYLLGVSASFFLGGVMALLCGLNCSLRARPSWRRTPTTSCSRCTA